MDISIDKRTVLIAIGIFFMLIGALAYFGFTSPSDSSTSMQTWGGTGAVAFLIGIGLLVWGYRTQRSGTSSR